MTQGAKIPTKSHRPFATREDIEEMFTEVQGQGNLPERTEADDEAEGRDEGKLQYEREKKRKGGAVYGGPPPSDIPVPSSWQEIKRLSAQHRPYCLTPDLLKQLLYLPRDLWLPLLGRMRPEVQEELIKNIPNLPRDRVTQMARWLIPPGHPLPQPLQPKYRVTPEALRKIFTLYKQASGPYKKPWERLGICQKTFRIWTKPLMEFVRSGQWARFWTHPGGGYMGWVHVLPGYVSVYKKGPWKKKTLLACAEVLRTKLIKTLRRSPRPLKRHLRICPFCGRYPVMRVAGRAAICQMCYDLIERKREPLEFPGERRGRPRKAESQHRDIFEGLGREKEDGLS